MTSCRSLVNKFVYTKIAVHVEIEFAIEFASNMSSMKKFNVKSPSHLGNKTASDRAKSFPGEFYVDSKILMCLACEKAVEHTRKSTIIDHLKSQKHRTNKQRKEMHLDSTAACTTSSSASATQRLQTTIFSAVERAQSAKDSRDCVVGDFLRAFLAANIPLEKADNVVLRDFLQRHVRNGGSIAGSRMLRNKVEDVYNEHREKLKTLFAGRNICVIVDETTDDRQKLVLNILFSLGVDSDN